MKTKIDSWNGLAKQLGFARRTVYNWRELPGSPAGTDLAAWKAFVSENDLGTVGNRVSKRRELALSRNIELRNKILLADLAAREKRLVPRADVNAMLLHVSSQQRACLFAALEREYPGKVVGRTASEISALGRSLADRLCDVFTREIEQWTWTEEPDPSRAPRE